MAVVEMQTLENVNPFVDLRWPFRRRGQPCEKAEVIACASLERHFSQDSLMKW